MAAGEGLPARQADLAISGHAFEARLYAEDVPAGFLPATGVLTHLAFPADARADSGVRAGDAISPFYDPMIAKLIVHGPTRGAALNALARALDRTQVAGCVTNLDFLAALARHPGFAAGDVDTGLIERDIAALTALPERPAAVTALAVLAAAGLAGGGGPLAGFALWGPLERTVPLRAGGDDIAARLAVRGPGRARVTLDGVAHDCARIDGVWRVDGRPVPADIHRDRARLTVFAGRAWAFDIPDPLARGAAAGPGDAAVTAPMPGLVKWVGVAPGQEVAEGDRLAVLEAMKMEHVLTAPRAGRIVEVGVGPGDQVAAGAVLIAFAEDAAGADPAA